MLKRLKVFVLAGKIKTGLSWIIDFETDPSVFQSQCLGAFDLVLK